MLQVTLFTPVQARSKRRIAYLPPFEALAQAGRPRAQVLIGSSAAKAH
jgi:hypothetical protein